MARVGERILKFVFFSFALLLCGTNLRAQTITISEQQDSAPESDQSNYDDAMPYNATDEQASASVLGAAPSLKTPSPVLGLCWSANNAYFALTEQNAIFIRDGFDSRLVHTIGYDGATSLQFAWDVVTETDMFMALSGGGKFSVWNFKDLPNQVAISGEVEPSYSVQLSNERRVTASVFSPSGNHMAVAFDDGTVNMSIVLHYTQKISDTTLVGHLGNVYSLDFSKDDGYLVSGGLDDKIFVWNATDGKKVGSMPFYSGSGAGVLFTADSKAVISVERPGLLSIRNFDGSRVMTIEPHEKNIKALKLTSDGKRLAALTAKDNIEFYDISTGKYVGYVPPFNQTSLTSYAFNRDDSVLLTGHADGSVYKLRLEKVFLKPGQKPPRMRMIGPDEVVVKGTAYTDKIPGSKDNKDFYKEGHQIFIDPFVGSTPEPFTFCIGLDSGYKNFNLVKPMYFGGGLSLNFSPDWGSYPYTYRYRADGDKLPNPFFVGAVLYGTVGLAVKPWKNDLVIFVDVNPGVSAQFIWNGKLASKAITSDLFWAFNVSSKLGIEYKRFNTAILVEYDALRKFTAGLELGWSINFGGGKKKNDKK
ncbi:MAG: hypothetical protein IK015_12375 [Treponema sp.]|nr:hypothetical protein [Treponema sp.]